MKRKYTVVIEGEAGSYSAYVPQLPTILITGASPEEIASRAREAIHLYLEYPPTSQSQAAILREVEVDFPA